MAEAEGAKVESGAEAIRQFLERRQWERLARSLGFEVVGTPVPEEALGAWGIPPESAGELEELEVLATGKGYRLIRVGGVERYGDVRRAMLAARRANPAECILWWLVGERKVTVAAAASGADGNQFVRRMEVELDEPDPVALRQLRALRLEEVAAEDVADPGRAFSRHVHGVLRQEEVTREFFRGFRGALEALTTELEAGPEDEQSRHEVALATLLRLVFLYFLQERGALDDDRRFVVRRYRSAVADGDSFYRDKLRPLFFGALNRTPDGRSDRARSLGRLPFLNGGLFEPLPAEREHPQMTWSNECWSEVVEELLERYRFAVDEGIGPDETRAVDPEMLGKVFEGLMYGERRHDSGSFYTPRDVVRRVVTEALVARISDATELGAELVRGLVTGEIRSVESSQREELEGLLESFHLLDPAVGTGAFLLEAMRAIERLYRACGDGGRADYERRRHVVHEHLFGVDVQTTAVRICELRIWLALLSVMPEDWGIEEIPPLPNLSHRVACGNSLLAPEEFAAAGAKAPAARAGAFRSVGEMGEGHREEMAQLEECFLRAHGRRKAQLRGKMEQLQRELQRDLIESRISLLEEKLGPYDRLESSEDLFGEPVDLEEAQRREKEEIVEELEALRTTLDDLEAERAQPAGFSFAARFGPSVGEAGFDVVVTNPPWVRANRLERSRRKRLEARYRSCSNDLWAGADEMGISLPFGAQVDLAAVFTERCLELLRPGGHLGALLPSKVFRSLHGSGLRGVLGENRIVSICDYSDGDREMFDATVYPATLQVRKKSREGAAGDRRRGSRAPRARQAAPLEMTVWRDSNRQQWSADPEKLPSLGDDVREPWLFVPPEIQQIFEKMWGNSRPLGTIPEVQPQRGLMTGRNRVFVREPSSVRELLGERADEWSRPSLSGRDVRAWEVEPDRRLLWAYDERLDPRKDLPEKLRNYFERHREELEGRADYNPKRPLWQLFRLKEGLTEPKVVWRDLAPRLEAAPASSEVVPLNTVYFIPFESDERASAAAGLFNSEPLRAYAYALGERARGGWRRHFCWVMRMLPIPEGFVRRIRADERSPGAELGGVPSREDRGAVDAWSREEFGLREESVAQLREWRRSGETARRREAA